MFSYRNASIPLLSQSLSEFEGHPTLRRHAFLLSLAFIFVIPWEGVELVGFGAAAIVVGYAAAVVWLATVLWTGRLRSPRAFQAMVVVFALWNALSILWSAEPGVTAARAMTWAQLLVFVYMLWDLYTTRAALFAGLQAYVLGAYVAVFSAISNFLVGMPFYNRYERFSAGDTNPDGFGFILTLGIPVAWYLASQTSTTRAERFLRVVNFAYIPVSFVGISLSGTRTALIATIPAMAFGLSSLMRLHRAARIAVLVLLGSTLLVVLSQVRSLASFQRFGTTVSEITEGDLNNRTKNWLEGLVSVGNHPLTGVGANMYRSVNSLGKLAHNSFLSVLVETGLIGVALFGAILTIAVVQALSQPAWERTFWLSQLAVWTIGASTLTWEHKKSTWLFLSLIVASAALARQRETSVTAPRDLR